jgi:AraC-like DNA-binding protein
MQLAIDFAGKFTRPETHTQITQAYFFGLTVSGFDYMRRYSPGGVLLSEHSECYMSLIPKGCRLEFSCNRDRENYVAICQLPELVWNESEQISEYNYQGSIIKFACLRPLDMAETLHLRSKFEQLVTLQQSPLPSERCGAELLLASLLKELILAPGSGSTPQLDNAGNRIAAALRSSIDRDNDFKYNISEHCEQLKFSISYCRKKFIAAYGIDPSEYRLRRRLEKIRTLLVHGGYNQKSVADMVGMKNVTHLHAFVKQRSGMPLGKFVESMPK